MLSRIDDFIFPNRCEVIEILPSQRYIYPIFKNGSSSITEHARTHNFKTLLNQQIGRVNIVDVIIREPTERFISGFNTFVYNLSVENPTLDVATIIFFAETYLFLNRHYCPQISWLVNLSKYVKPNTKIQINAITDLNKFTPLHTKPPVKWMLTPNIVDRLTHNIHNEMYIRLDNLLMDLTGHQVTFNQIINYIKTHDAEAYKKFACIVLE